MIKERENGKKKSQHKIPYQARKPGLFKVGQGLRDKIAVAVKVEPTHKTPTIVN